MQLSKDSGGGGTNVRLEKQTLIDTISKVLVWDSHSIVWCQYISNNRAEILKKIIVKWKTGEY